MLDTLLDIKEKEIITIELTKEDLDKVRDIEGFPIGKDEDIIALSRLPYYTACPNPFIEEFIEKHGKPYDEETDTYKREPFAADVSEGKYDAIYKMHPYHTKVPHKAIMRYILHYTEPGDIIFDGFCGTGMSGVAAQMCEFPDNDFRLKINSEIKGVKWGARKAVLSDISPIATFIARNFNSSIGLEEIKDKVKKIIMECKKECEWMYITNHIDKEKKDFELSNNEGKGIINYVIWSDVFICPSCGEEIIFWEESVDKDKGKVKETFNCHACNIELKKKECKAAETMVFDKALNKNIIMSKQVPVLINYSFNNRRYEKKPDKYDLELIEKIEDIEINQWYPTNRMCEGKEARRNDKAGITHVHHFYTKRNLYTLSLFRERIDINSSIAFALTKVANQLTKQYRLTYMNGCWGAGGGPMSGTLYISSLVKELNMLHCIEEALKNQFMRKLKGNENIIISTQSSTNVTNIPNDCIDYIFTDPPFGENLNYSELNFIWESWLRVYTNNKAEAIINKVQGKSLVEYQNLITECFQEYYRVLKPNRWITIEFHNSKNSVWVAIQEALAKSGFIVSDVRTLDKQHNSFKQVTTSSAVKQDLIISAYKPKDSFKERFINNSGSEESVWDFIREHLIKVPVIIKRGQNIECIKEREAFLLYDKMIAYHVVNGLAIPIDSTTFYAGLDERFIKRDGMYFLHDQINEYDSERVMAGIEPIQFSLLISDEKNAIAWLYQQLEIPQTYGEVMPKFMQELRVLKHEKMPELMELLEENFLKDDEGKWYIPDITKSGDLIKLREKRLVKEFEEYLKGKGKLKVFRTEAIRAGFAKLWKEKDYKDIVKVAERLPESVIQEDDKLLMYYDISLSRIE